MGGDKSYNVIATEKGVPIKAWTKGVPLEDQARAQLLNVAQLPFIFKWVAAMPDVHWGIGATVGSVIPTKGAIIPAAVGVDIGCGMMAVQTDLNARDLPDNLKPIRSAIEKAVPHGRTNHGGKGDVGGWQQIPARNAEVWQSLKPRYDAILEKHPKLDRGNHSIHLGADARNAGDPSLVGKWFGWWFLVWLVAYAFIYALQLPAKGTLDSPWVRSIGVAVVVVAASWLILALNGGPAVSNPHLAISVGGGLGLIMLLNTWGVVWRVQKRLIAWSRASSEQGTPMPPEAERLMRWNYLTARTSFWLSFPMLFFMAAASHYPFLSSVPR
ncbi:MAG: hypothetical protein DMG37_01860 [Acidobacteria bacterium]|nr:MAG: hypothetical protein DMG37_01860 [Acidobacteriota bacterium]